jgi:glycosyltransferase involved in cell wall biosynthesis
MKPPVSVIVTSYNHAEYLDQRIASLLEQTHSEIEIIVIDDYSTDKSREVLEKYRSNGKVNLVLLEENGGYAAACNKGVALSKGDYVMFAECDDYNDPRHIATLENILEENEGVGVVFSRSNIVDATGKILGNDYEVRERLFRDKCLHDTLIPKELMRKYFLFSCVIPNMSAALIRKSCINKIGGLSSGYLVCADWDFWCRLAEQTDFYYVADSLNYFRTHPNTVRKNASIGLQVGECYDLLYRSFSRMSLSLNESMRFRLRCGFTWANLIIVNPSDWFKSLPTACRKSFRCDRLSLLYLMAGLAIKAVRFLQRRVLPLKKINIKIFNLAI